VELAILGLRLLKSKKGSMKAGRSATSEMSSAPCLSTIRRGTPKWSEK
jgi:hypothetical protein